jgi:hypothetical protein
MALLRHQPRSPRRRCRVLVDRVHTPSVSSSGLLSCHETNPHCYGDPFVYRTSPLFSPSLPLFRPKNTSKILKGKTTTMNQVFSLRPRRGLLAPHLLPPHPIETEETSCSKPSHRYPRCTSPSSSSFIARFLGARRLPGIVIIISLGSSRSLGAHVSALAAPTDVKQNAAWVVEDQAESRADGTRLGLISSTVRRRSSSSGKTTSLFRSSRHLCPPYRFPVPSIRFRRVDVKPDLIVYPMA